MKKYFLLNETENLVFVNKKTYIENYKIDRIFGQIRLGGSFMKKTNMMAVALTTAVICACSSDDAVSTQDKPLTGSSMVDSIVLEKGPVKMGKCLGEPGGETFLAKKTSEPAVIFPSENGEYEIMLPAVMDYCGIDAPVITRMAGDTLVISYDESDIFSVTNCVCVTDHYFRVNEHFIGAKFAKFSGRVFEVRFIENPSVLDVISDETAAQERQPMQTFPEDVFVAD